MSAVPVHSHDADIPGSTVAVWLVSIAIHGLLLLLVATSSGTWFGRPGPAGDTGASRDGDEFRSVGVVLKPVESDQPAENPADAAEPADEPGKGRPVAAAEGPVVPDRAPVELDLPRANDRVLGPGHLAPPNRAPGDVGEVVRPGGAFDRVPVAGLAPGETRFFGIRDQGLRILYLIDVSGSMGGAKLAAAKSQFLASLESLTEKQQFQVLFYSTTTRPMRLGLPDRSSRQTALFAAEGVYLARSVNKTLARQYLGSVGADVAGTDRVQALEEGLKYQPDVLYFLTDGDGVELDAKKRQRLVERNDGRTRIHCIEFGEGPPPTVRTPLKRLAGENDGLYRYVAVGSLR